MNGVRMLPSLAQADVSAFSGLEGQIVEHAAWIGALYAGIVLFGLVVLGWFIFRLRRQPLPWATFLSRLYWRPWSLTDCQPILLVLVGAFLFSLLVQAVWLASAADSASARTAHLVVVQSLLFHWTGLLTVAWFLRRRRLPWRSAFGLEPATLGRDLGRGLLVLAGTMPILVGSAVIYNLFLQLFGFQPSLQEVAFIISGETSPWLRAYFIFLAVVLAPVVEEILFRGMLLPALAKRFGAAAAVVVIAVVFAAIHAHVPSLVPLFVLSTSLSLAYIGTGSLAASIIMHAIFNSITVSLLFAVQGPS
jgi:membrane protease YdiL (CAAX protease family)